MTLDRMTELAIVSAVHATTVQDNSEPPLGSTTELDSHANMVVVGQQATVISDSGTYAEVKAFADDCKTLERVPIVDAAIAYDCPSTHETFILIVRNALLVRSMAHNLIPPFIMREAGIEVNDVPRIHCDTVTNSSHAIICRGENANVRIPLRLRGAFSYFPTRKLTDEEIDGCDNITAICLTPDTKVWDPNCETWGEEEDKFVDPKGELVGLPPPKRRKLIHEDDFDAEPWIEINVSSTQWESTIDKFLEADNADCIPIGPDLTWTDEMDLCDPIRAQVCNLTGVLDQSLLAENADETLCESKFCMAAGCTAALLEGIESDEIFIELNIGSSSACLLYTSPSPRDQRGSRMPSSA